MIKNYAEIGARLARYRVEVNESLDEAIAATKPDRLLLMLLSAVLEALQGQSLELRDLRYLVAKQRKAEADECIAVQDGFLYWSKVARGDALIQAQNTEHLSPKARRVIAKLGAVLTSEVTPERLAEVKYCGEKTTSEILGWIGTV